MSIKSAEIMTEDPLWQEWLEVTYKRGVKLGQIEPNAEVEAMLKAETK
ncbi:hypothetical protein [Nocardioides sp. NPDC006273]